MSGQEKVACAADGMLLAGWQPPSRPGRSVLQGGHCRLEPLESSRHAAELHAANSLDRDGTMWEYLAYGPFIDEAAYAAWVAAVEHSNDPLFFAIVDARTGRAGGVASYLRMDPAHGVIEVGHLAYSPQLQRTAAATEAMYLMMQQAFALGYRRYEWKCNARNAASRRAAERLGFTFEGVFRQHMVYKGRNRDTAWYSIIDSEWPAVDAAFRAWLEPGNFDADGRQRSSLGGLREALARGATTT
jgi:RimJ/RimL family protein N-acetyltransferase